MQYPAISLRYVTSLVYTTFMLETFTLFLVYVLSIFAPSGSGGATQQLVLRPDAPILIRTATPVRVATATRTRTRTPTPRRSSPTATRTPTPAKPIPSPTAKKVVVKGKVYDAYVTAATKAHQEYHYSCEFDAAWVILKTNGFDVKVDQQAAIVGLSKGPEPYYKETSRGIFIYGGDITTSYSGNYKTNFLARSTGQAMRKVFDKYGLRVTPVNTKEGIQAALLRGELVWIKTTVDFKPWKAATWVMPDGRTYKTVLGNDHAVVVMGFNKDVVVIRDVLGPTSTGLNRPYEYEVPWSKFMASWGAQLFDGLAVGKPR